MLLFASWNYTKCISTPLVRFLGVNIAEPLISVYRANRRVGLPSVPRSAASRGSKVALQLACGYQRFTTRTISYPRLHSHISSHLDAQTYLSINLGDIEEDDDAFPGIMIYAMLESTVCSQCPTVCFALTDLGRFVWLGIPLRGSMISSRKDGIDVSRRGHLPASSVGILASLLSWWSEIP